MAGQFRTTQEEMRAFSARMAEVNGQIQQQLSRLGGVVDAVASGWQGEAADAYRQLQHKWNEDARRLNRVLGEMKDAIDSTAAQYATTEQEQRGGIGRITAALG